ncbi:hypothetical protein HGO23_13125 [Xenorhabdus budapestensis]|uniref:Uncharacterized protein n=1 Tax=Xenorhabdus budapestensis TaxID=290110 RepID=A0ABX7VDA0_XENBU|nr:hypothetical protein [Xenorhabdus budapestensis]QTL38816.1 hypothetical protein HGO23_13125 [Xenorhabdus budapestensis]
MKINKVIDKMLAFCLTKGVQPDELVTAIFENEYDSIETLKKKNYINVIVTYKDCDEHDESIIKMKYIYNTDRQLLRVEQKINSGNYQVQWDRESTLDLILKELLELFESEQQTINLIKDQIPAELRGIIYPKLKLAC